MNEIANQTLGESKTSLYTDNHDEIDAILEHLIVQARRYVALAAARLEHRVFSSSVVYDALAHLASIHPRNSVRILIEDEEFFRSKNARLLGLCRRFSSYVKIHTIPEEYLPFNEMLLVIDGAGFAHQPSLEQPHVSACFNARPDCRRLLHRFDEIWDRSATINEISTLGL